MSDGFKFTIFIVGLVFVGAIIGITADKTEDTSYPESSYTTNSETVREFGGYECTSDCSGHEAGYDWAYDNDVCDTEFDGGNSESFAEGVRAYSEENC